MTRLGGLLTALFVGLALLGGPGAMAAPTFPELTGRVVDAANVIPAVEEARLTQKLAALETQSRRQLVVVTLPSLQGYEISDYGYQLGRAWGIGSKDRNDGALLIVAPNERKLRIEVGYGLEPILTDGMSFLIIDQTIVPRFKADDLAGGIEAGTDAIIHQLTLPPDEAAKVASQADQAAQDETVDPMAVIVAIVIILFFVVPVLSAMFGGGHGRRRIGASGGPFVWIPPSGSSSSWGSGSDWGGGGFSGGGGSFGGGGSSGSW